MDIPDWIIRKAHYKAFIWRTTDPKPKIPVLSLPFMNNCVSRQCQYLLRRSGLIDKLRICFRSRPVSSFVRLPPSNGLCEDNCVTCSCAESQISAFSKA